MTERETHQQQADAQNAEAAAEHKSYLDWCRRHQDTPKAWGDRHSDDVGYGYRR